MTKTQKILLGLILCGFIAIFFTMCASAQDHPDDCNPYRKVIMTASPAEMKELEQILYLECNGEPFEGQVACCQVILNRVLSDAYPNTIHEVLSQVDCGYRQFSTWKSRDKADPGETQSDVICHLVNGGEWFLPYTDYVYFSRKKIEGKDSIRIGKHVFTRRTTK